MGECGDPTLNPRQATAAGEYYAESPGIENWRSLANIPPLPDRSDHLDDLEPGQAGRGMEAAAETDSIV